MIKIHSKTKFILLRENNQHKCETKFLVQIQSKLTGYIKKNCKRIVFFYSNSCDCRDPPLIKPKILIFYLEFFEFKKGGSNKYVVPSHVTFDYGLFIE
jgi:hypothetical protein